MPRSPVDVQRLCQAVHNSRLALRFPREERREAVRQYVGRHWSEEGARDKVPCNLLSLYVGIVARNLIAKNPRCLLSTFQQSYKPVVSAMEQWVNEQIEHVNLAATLERVVVDALFSIGVCKVALATPADAATFGWALKGGEPFAERVDLDDFVFDIHARDIREATFIGHRFRAPLRVIRESKIYSSERRQLTASDDPSFNLEGDERISMLGRTYLAGNQEEFEEHVDLWEVYLPRHRVVLTLSDDHLLGPSASGREPRPLRAQRWLGPECGPYHILGLGIVPGNAMPKGPVQDLVDLHMSVNAILRKMLRQADRQKEVTFVRGAAAEDGDRTVRANDGDAIKVDDPQGINTVEFGVVSQKNAGLFIAMKDLFSWLAGNLDMMGGLSPQSKTLGQDRLLAENASLAVSDMQDRCVTFTAGVLRALCWYWHNHPRKVMRVAHPVPGLPGMHVTRRVFPAQDPRGQRPAPQGAMRRTGRFEDLKIKVDPYSMQHQTPQSRMAALDQTVQQLLPVMQLLQQQGIMFDANNYLQKKAHYLDMPDLPEIFTVGEPPQDSAASGDQPGMPAQTNRTYTRENRSAPTRQGADLNAFQTLMSGKEPGGKNGQSGGGP